MKSLAADHKLKKDDGLSEVHRKNTNLIQLLRSNHLLYRRRKQVDNFTGVGFLMIVELASNNIKLGSVL